MLIRKIIRRFFDLSLRRKLILSSLIVIVLGGVLFLIVGTRIMKQTIVSLAEAKVRHDLASAWMVYEERLHTLRDTVRLSATQEFLRAALRQETSTESPGGSMESVGSSASTSLISRTPSAVLSSGRGAPMRPSATAPPGTLSSPSPSGKRFPAGPGSSPGRSSSRRGPTSPNGRVFNSSRRPWRPSGLKTMRTRA